MATLIRIDRNGTKYYTGAIACTRCGGQGGADAWAYTGWICYRCGGTGTENASWKEYTPEYEAKLMARRQARAEAKRAKYEAEHAEEIAQKKAEEQARLEAQRKSDEEEKARKAKSQFIGNIGDKINTTAIYERSAHFEVRSFRGYGTETMYIHMFRIGDDKVIWKTTTNNLGRWNDQGQWEAFDEGIKVNLKGTVKEHSEYRDEKQTILTRCKVEEA